MADATTTWADDELRSSPSVREITLRLLQRSRRTWKLWFGIISVACVGLAVQKVRHPPIRPAEVIIRLVEGSIETSRTPLSTRLLWTKIFDLAFTRPNLLEIIRRYPAGFPRLAVDPTAAVDDLLSGVDVVVSENDFVEYRLENDPPRSVKITVGFTAPMEPEMAWAVARDLADLVVKSEVAGQRKAIAIEAAASAEAEALGADALKTLLADRTQLTDKNRSPDAPPQPSPILANTGRRIAEAQRQDIGNRLLMRAVDEQQALHVELVDPGRPPLRVRGLASLQSVLVIFPLLLLVAALTVGAFDPRVLDDQDLRSLGIAPLGHARARPRV